MPNPVAATVGSSVVGLVGANKAAAAQRGAADRAATTDLAIAEMQAEAAREAAQKQEEASKFRPVGVTTAFGESQYTIGPDGYLTSAGYQLSPEMLAQRESLMGMLPGTLSQALATDNYYGNLAQRYAGMGEEALSGINLDPTQAAEERLRRITELQQPGRELERERLFSNLASKGLTGLAVETGTGARVNPLATSMYEDWGQQDRLAAIDAYDRARGDIASDLQRATGLFDTGRALETYQSGRLGQALAPYQAVLSQAGALEDLGRQALTLGMGYSADERQAALRGAGAAAEGITGAANALATGQGSAADIAYKSAMNTANQQAARWGAVGNTLGGLDYSKLFGAQQPVSTQQSFAAPNYRPNVQGTITQGTFTPGKSFL